MEFCSVVSTAVSGLLVVESFLFGAQEEGRNRTPNNFVLLCSSA